ncbi:MAG: flavin reductase [Saprospiraceae bacterium]|nr:flavin reductase [Saprospiraceae bacterium]
MIEKFKKIPANEIQGNAVKMIGSDSMLISAGNIKSFNTMTAAWGGIGFLWKMPVVYIFIRPQRYTYEFVERNDYFTISFFEKEYQKILNFCGTKSGRDYDKIAETGLIPIETENENIIYEQSYLSLECKKLYFDDLNPANFLSDDIHKVYPTKDFHRMYIGEIVNTYTKY